MEKKELKVAEFFSGIGGMRYACEAATLPPEIENVNFIAAFDINQIANQVYHHNFSHNPITTNVEHLPREFYEELQADVWLLSPPCQPYTRGGKLLDDQDNRAIGLIYLIGVLEAMKNPPEYVFVENVLNFEVSRSREKLVAALKTRGFELEEYLVSPLDLGIPNNRLRYYLIARRKTNTSEQLNPLITSLKNFFVDEPCKRKIVDFLRPSTNQEIYAVPSKYLTDYKEYRHDVVHPLDHTSTTFTKSYGSKHIIGTGSFLQTDRLDLREHRKDDPEILVTLGLRFFTPIEISLLHAFPVKGEADDCSHYLEFPANISIINQYRLLGNSLNVQVVKVLLTRLFNLL